MSLRTSLSGIESRVIQTLTPIFVLPHKRHVTSKRHSESASRAGTIRSVPHAPYRATGITIKGFPRLHKIFTMSASNVQIPEELNQQYLITKVMLFSFLSKICTNELHNLQQKSYRFLSVLVSINNEVVFSPRVLGSTQNRHHTTVLTTTLFKLFHDR